MLLLSRAGRLRHPCELLFASLGMCSDVVQRLSMEGLIYLKKLGINVLNVAFSRFTRMPKML